MTTPAASIPGATSIARLVTACSLLTDGGSGLSSLLLSSGVGVGLAVVVAEIAFFVVFDAARRPNALVDGRLNEVITREATPGDGKRARNICFCLLCLFTASTS